MNMPEMNNKTAQDDFTRNSIEAVIRIGLLLLLAAWCFQIISPFIIPVMWGIIIAVAIYPLFTRLSSLLGGREKLAATIYTLIALALLITPTVMIANSAIETSAQLTERYEAGTLEVPPPSDAVKEWPIVGDRIYAFWQQASENLETALKTHTDQVKKISKAVLGAVAGTGGAILQFVLSIIISGILVVNAEGAYKASNRIFARLSNDDKGQSYTDLTKATIRSVAQGVLGVAIIQAILSAVGMAFMEVPGWELWTLLILILAIAQLPPLLVLGFVIAYVFSVADTTPAVIFMIYALIVSASDGFLKPLFLGRGMETPMLVILLGAIGGMMLSGIIGLFVGAVGLALGYELFLAWLDQGEEIAEKEATE